MSLDDWASLIDQSTYPTEDYLLTLSALADWLEERGECGERLRMIIQRRNFPVKAQGDIVFWSELGAMAALPSSIWDSLCRGKPTSYMGSNYMDYTTVSEAIFDAAGITN